MHTCSIQQTRCGIMPSLELSEKIEIFLFFGSFGWRCSAKGMTFRLLVQVFIAITTTTKQIVFVRCVHQLRAVRWQAFRRKHFSIRAVNWYSVNEAADQPVRHSRCQVFIFNICGCVAVAPLLQCLNCVVKYVYAFRYDTHRLLVNFIDGCNA